MIRILNKCDVDRLEQGEVTVTVSVTPVFLLFSGLKLLVFAAFCLNSERFAEYPLMLHLRAVGAVENEPIQRLIGDDLIRSRSTFYAVLINIFYYIVWCTILLLLSNNTLPSLQNVTVTLLKIKILALSVL